MSLDQFFAYEDDDQNTRLVVSGGRGKMVFTCKTRGDAVNLKLSIERFATNFNVEPLDTRKRTMDDAREYYRNSHDPSSNLP